MINYLNTKFIKSASKASEIPGDDLPEILLCGKSNVGKSSLINALCAKKDLAYTSSKPGHTRLLNYYDVDHKFYLVDAPGYGYAHGGVNLDKLFGELMNDYFANNKRLKMILLLLNSERTLSNDDEALISLLRSKNIKFNVIFTKIDKLNQSEVSALKKYAKEQNIDNYFFSAQKNKDNIKTLRNYIQSILTQ